MTNEDILIELINSWLFHNNKLREITQYLYKSTELFERKYEDEFNHDLYDFFSGKITTYSRQENILRQLLDDKQTIKLNLAKLLERSK